MNLQYQGVQSQGLPHQVPPNQQGQWHQDPGNHQWIPPLIQPYHPLPLPSGGYHQQRDQNVRDARNADLRTFNTNASFVNSPYHNPYGQLASDQFYQSILE